jgi:hypothetical protein
VVVAVAGFMDFDHCFAAMTAKGWRVVQVGLFSFADSAGAERTFSVAVDCDSLCCHLGLAFGVLNLNFTPMREIPWLYLLLWKMKELLCNSLDPRPFFIFFGNLEQQTSANCGGAGGLILTAFARPVLLDSGLSSRV